MRHVLLSVDKIKAGDVYGPGETTVWTAVEDAKLLALDGVTVRVEFPDGGLETREFDIGHELEIKRDV